MSKQRTIIIIDLSKYCTQQQYAIDNNVRLNTVSQWVKRAKAGEGKAKIEYFDIPELSITLVRR